MLLKIHILEYSDADGSVDQMERHVGGHSTSLYSSPSAKEDKKKKKIKDRWSGSICNGKEQI